MAMLLVARTAFVWWMLSSGSVPEKGKGLRGAAS